MQHLSFRQLFITNPSRSVGLKKSVDLIFKFTGEFHNFRDAGTTYQNPGLPDNPGRMACMPCNKAIAFHISMTAPKYAINP